AVRQMVPELGTLARRDAGPHDAQGQGAVHGAGRHQRVAKPLGQESGRGALARARRAVDRDHRRLPAWHQSSARTTGVPARALSVAANCGNEVATHAVSSMTVSPSATRPATASAIATR